MQNADLKKLKKIYNDLGKCIATEEESQKQAPPAQAESTPRTKVGRATCPFYVHESSVAVTCEGYGAGETLNIHFKTPAKAVGYFAKYCYSGHKECPYYRFLYEDKYKMED